MKCQELRSLYAAFDLHPSSKGASTHIEAFSNVLFEILPTGWLYCLGPNEQPERMGQHYLEHFSQHIPNYLSRARAYSGELFQKMRSCRQLELVHFRDIWSGLAILNSDHNFRTVFEVNGLPSIELKYRYPQLTSATLQKIISLEKFCLQQSEIIITPSNTTKNYLLGQGVSESRVQVIPNGADLNGTGKNEGKPVNMPYLIYFGALQPWQGLDTLIKALALLQDYPGLHLVICSSQPAKFAKPYAKMAEKAGLASRIIWQYQLEKSELQRYLSHALLSIAPLKSCDRNIVQGCAPLKILESMATGIAVVASDLPPVRELVQNHVNGKLVRADRPADLARAIRILLDYPEQRQKIAHRGLQTIDESYQWTQQKQLLKEIYENIYAF
ncbi:MAG: glycosyltransferase family 4 protein [Candidatus Cyclobacteriaceae bacterium M3_2C_046]